MKCYHLLVVTTFPVPTFWAINFVTDGAREIKIAIDVLRLLGNEGIFTDEILLDGGSGDRTV